ncbi:phosphoenolpyruvate carboxykinase (ATP) [Bradymonas sediminis]|uniref:Phosphoenolpyruvate carboxykinase (ATP) n=1 Tax=Bradymonas sediminis TaxID=1548548 RepID=A0A2Z4FFY6_9DELT|nr:phosphoenolpyruvate carboxykinase (ATP) [Bradymonas sediminis]AWV87832.1 phosphoenolpyruvate carboxykinase (ATP) [Bradymonas sediminis]TDP73927.1 phosphoenolpyruvate carboxykinase (ATP) [Bradymonas sediminis]
MSALLLNDSYGITVENLLRNATPARLYEEALKHEKGTAISEQGALMAFSGEKTGRTPKDKRVVRNPESQDDIWWGDINIPLEPEVWQINRQRAVDFLNTQERLYVFDGYAGWDDNYSIKVRIICARAYHALFMHNMLRRPTAEELETFGEPDFTILNAGQFPANPHTAAMTSDASVDLNFEAGEMVILGTQYAGEMKKGIFTLMHYLMPKQDVLSMHCSCNEGGDNTDVSLFFGLSGTGKTTLSSDPNRKLIGDDEHCWTDDGVFNIEGGCYAKTIDLSAKAEPLIYETIGFGSVLENVVYDPETRAIDFSDDSITKNTRTAYPITKVRNAKIPCVTGHPDNIILLTCDAFGVLPPVSQLTPAQAMYHFISGYTAKVAGTEVGVTEPEATFSACFGAAFLVWPPTKYAEMLADKMRKHNAKAWLVNTGWTGGAYGTGERISLKHTRAIIDAIHSGELAGVETQNDPYFGVAVPTTCPNVPTEVLTPQMTWANQDDFEKTAQKLVGLFQSNFAKYADQASDEIVNSGPVLK